MDATAATTCEPGSEGKIALLAERYRLGVRLWVPGDVTYQPWRADWRPCVRLLLSDAAIRDALMVRPPDSRGPE